MIARLRQLRQQATSPPGKWKLQPDANVFCMDRNDAALAYELVNCSDALLDVAEAAEGVVKYAREVDLQAAVVLSGYPDLRDALARLKADT